MRRIKYEIADMEWRLERDRAESVSCRWCDAEPGEHCINPITGDEINAPAHPPRIADALEKEASR